jgi:hypothetical protein
MKVSQQHVDQFELIARIDKYVGLATYTLILVILIRFGRRRI